MYHINWYFLCVCVRVFVWLVVVCNYLCKWVRVCVFRMLLSKVEIRGNESTHSCRFTRIQCHLRKQRSESLQQLSSSFSFPSSMTSQCRKLDHPKMSKQFVNLHCCRRSKADKTTYLFLSNILIRIYILRNSRILKKLSTAVEKIRRKQKIKANCVLDIPENFEN